MRRVATIALMLPLFAGACAPSSEPDAASTAPASDPPAETTHWFADRSYAVAIGDRPPLLHWRIDRVGRNDAPPAGDVVFRGEFPSAGEQRADPAIRVTVRRLPHSRQVGGMHVPARYEFRSWGKLVLVSDWAELCRGLYEDWTKTSSDPIRGKSVPPSACAMGPAEIWGCAVATDAKSRRRERRDWYCWATTQVPGAFTYVAEFVTTDPKLVMSDGALPQVAGLVASIRR